MSKYLESRAWVRQLQNEDQTGIKELVDEYNDVYSQCGEFTAARFLIDVYTTFQLNLKEAQNG